MYLKFDVKITEGHYPKQMTKEAITENVNFQFSSELARAIQQAKPISHVDHNTREIKAEVVVILNPEDFLNMLKGEVIKDASNRELCEKIVTYIDEE